jgi:hypothetical protein
MVSLDAFLLCIFIFRVQAKFLKLRNSKPNLEKNATMFEIINLTRPTTSSTEITGQI